jgi:ferredoxin
MSQPLVHHVTLETPAGTRSIDCSEDEFIWNAAARSGISLPAICHQGRCLSCAALRLEGRVDQSASVSYFPEDARENFVLPCTAKPKSDLHLITHQQTAMRQRRRELGLPSPYS